MKMEKGVGEWFIFLVFTMKEMRTGKKGETEGQKQLEMTEGGCV